MEILVQSKICKGNKNRETKFCSMMMPFYFMFSNTQSQRQLKKWKNVANFWQWYKDYKKRCDAICQKYEEIDILDRSPCKWNGFSYLKEQKISFSSWGMSQFPININRTQRHSLPNSYLNIRIFCLLVASLSMLPQTALIDWHASC